MSSQFGTNDNQSNEPDLLTQFGIDPKKVVGNQRQPQQQGGDGDLLTQLGIEPPERTQQPVPERTWGEAFSDVGKGAMSALTGLTGNEDSAQQWKDRQSDTLQALRANREVARAEAGDDSMERLKASAKETFSSGALAADFVARELPQYAKAGAQAVIPGAAGTIGSTLRGAARLFGDEEGAESSRLARAGTSLVEWGDKRRERIAEEFRDSFAADLGQGVGSMAVFLPVGYIGGAAGAAVAGARYAQVAGNAALAAQRAKAINRARGVGQFTAAATTATASAGDEAYERAARFGLDHDQAQNIARWVAPVSGPIQVANINLLLRGMPASARERLFSGTGGEILKGALSEFVVEGVGGAIVQNIGEMTYNHERKWHDDALYQALIGAGSAGISQTARAALARTYGREEGSGGPIPTNPKPTLPPDEAEKIASQLAAMDPRDAARYLAEQIQANEIRSARESLQTYQQVLGELGKRKSDEVLQETEYGPITVGWAIERTKQAMAGAQELVARADAEGEFDAALEQVQRLQAMRPDQVVERTQYGDVTAGEMLERAQKRMNDAGRRMGVDMDSPVTADEILSMAEERATLLEQKVQNGKASVLERAELRFLENHLDNPYVLSLALGAPLATGNQRNINPNDGPISKAAVRAIDGEHDAAAEEVRAEFEALVQAESRIASQVAQPASREVTELAALERTLQSAMQELPDAFSGNARQEIMQWMSIARNTANSEADRAEARAIVADTISEIQAGRPDLRRNVVRARDVVPGEPRGSMSELAARERGMEFDAFLQEQRAELEQQREFASLQSAERADLDQRIDGIVRQQRAEALRREIETADADIRQMDARQRDTARNRLSILESVLADESTANPEARFAAELRRQGYADAKANERERSMIGRYQDVVAALSDDGTAPSAPNELDAAAVGIRERQPKTAQTQRGEQRLFPFASQVAADKEAARRSQRDGQAFVAVAHPTQAGRFAVVPSSQATSSDLTGERINRAWVAFADDSGSLNIPRAEMPQISAEHRGAMVNFMNARGVQHERMTVPADSLRPTQAEYAPGKVKRAKEFTGGDRAILVSSDGHVLDGHHQWLARREQGQPIDVIKLDAPIADLIELAHAFPSSTTAGGAPAASKQRTAADRRREAYAKSHPFRAFIGRHGGVNPSAQADVMGERGGRRNNPMIPFSGPAFRRDGKNLDELARLAVQDGFLTKADLENPADTFGTRKLADMIRAEFGGATQRTVADAEAGLDAQAMSDDLIAMSRMLEAVGIDTANMNTFEQLRDALESEAYEAALIDMVNALAINAKWQDAVERHAVATEVAYNEDLTDAQARIAIATEIDEGAVERAALQSEDDVDFLNRVEEVLRNADSETYAAAVARYRRETEERSAGARGATGSQGGRAAVVPEAQADGRGAQGQQEGLELSTYTPEELAEREAKVRATEDAEAREQREAEERERQAREREDIKRRSEVAASTFELGGDPLINLSGQTGLFDAPAVPTQAPTAPEQSRPAPGQRSEPAQPNTDRALSLILDATDGNGEVSALNGPENLKLRTEVISALTGRTVADLEADARHKFLTSVRKVEDALFDALGIEGDVLADRRSKYLEFIDSREPGAQQTTERFAAGAALSKEERKQVLSTLTDVYRSKNHQKETRVDARGEEYLAYPYAPELFERSDITGKMVRYYVTLPDGRVAHPTELFPEYTEAQVERQLESQEAESRKSAENDADRRRILESRKADTLNEANRIFNQQNRGRGDYVPATLTDGKRFIRTHPDSVANDLRLLGDGWAQQPAEVPGSESQPTAPGKFAGDFSTLEQASEAVIGKPPGTWAIYNIGGSFVGFYSIGGGRYAGGESHSTRAKAIESVRNAARKAGFETEDAAATAETKPAGPAQSTAPEHAAVGVDDGELSEIVAEFNDAQASMLEGEDRIHHLFDAPAKSEVVRLNDKAKVYHKDHGWMTPAEARKKIEEWKAHAASQNNSKTGNHQKVVLSLFDYTGKWSQPWEDAGYQVYRFDIQQDPEVGDINNFSTEFFGDWFGDFDGQDIYAILAACPCTDFASSGARHFAAKDEDGRTVASVRLVHQTLATIEHFRPAVWALENPVGRIEKLGGLPPWRLSFDPNHLGDPYTKKTLLWGRFNGDLPVVPVEPTEGSKMHSQYGGKSLATKNARSATPEGFAYGFFMANNAHDHPAMAVSFKYDRLDRSLIEKAIEAGVTPEQIDRAVEDFYYMDLDDGAANDAIRDLTDAQQKESASNPEQQSEQFENYRKWIEGQSPSDLSANRGARKEILVDERLNDGEAETLAALFDERAGRKQPVEDTAPAAQQKESASKPDQTGEKEKWIKAAVDKSRLNGSGGVQLSVTPQGGITFLGDPRSNKDGQSLLAAYEKALAAGATQQEIAAALQASKGQTRPGAQSTQAAPAETAPQVLTVKTFKHTKTGETIYSVPLPNRVERDAYEAAKRRATVHKGRYSAFRGGGAVPGFHFKSEANAQAFAADPAVLEAAGVGVESTAVMWRQATAEQAEEIARLGRVPARYLNSDYDAMPESVQRMIQSGLRKMQDQAGQTGAGAASATSPLETSSSKAVNDFIAGRREDAPTTDEVDVERAASAPIAPDGWRENVFKARVYGKALLDAGQIKNPDALQAAWGRRQTLVDEIDRQMEGDGAAATSKASPGDRWNATPPAKREEILSRPGGWGTAPGAKSRLNAYGKRIAEKTWTEQTGPTRDIIARLMREMDGEIEQPNPEAASLEATPVEPQSLGVFRAALAEGRKAHFDYAGVDGRTVWIEQTSSGWVVKVQEDGSNSVFTTGGNPVAGGFSKAEAIERAARDAEHRFNQWKPVAEQSGATDLALADKTKTLTDLGVEQSQIEKAVDEYKDGDPTLIDDLLRITKPEDAAAPAQEDADLGSMFDDFLAEEIAAQKPARTRKPRAKKAPSASASKAERTAGEAAKSATKNVASGASNALQALGELFGGNGRLSSGLSFDEQTYAKAKPLFIQAVKDFGAAGKDIADVMRAIVKAIVSQFGSHVAGNMKPYAVQFVKDVRDGKIDYTETEGTQEDTNNERRGTDSESDQALGRVPAGEDGGPEGSRDTGVQGKAGGRARNVRNSATGTPRPAAARSGRDGSAGVHHPAPGTGSVTGSLPAKNFVITDIVRLGEGGEVTKFKDNVAAIQIVKKLDAERRRATPEEQAALARYVGWGGLAQAFRNPQDNSVRKGWEDRVALLEALLSPDELKSARATTTDAHYTSKPVVDAAWQIAERMGFAGGVVLESSVGVGNFIGLMPESVRGMTRVQGVEVDGLTVKIARALYPQESILHSPFQNVPMPANSVDMAIGNPPFGKTSLYFPYSQHLNGKSIHNQFILGAMDAVKPGGLSVQVVSRFFMDAKDSTSRRQLAEQAEIVAAIRLPDTAFVDNAMTEVVTDMLVIRKLTNEEIAERAEAAGKNPVPVPSWVETTEVSDPLGGDPITVNRYFAQNPEMMLGVMERSGSMRRENDATLRAPAGMDIAAALAERIESIPQRPKVTSENIEASLKQFEAMRESLELTIGGFEEGAVIFNEDGALVQVTSRESGSGRDFLTRRVITPASPWHSSLMMDVDGNWFRVTPKLDERGNKVKSGRFVAYDRETFKSEKDVPENLRLGDGAYRRLLALANMRDTLKRQLVMEAANESESAIEENRAKLRKEYEEFTQQHGFVGDRANQSLLAEMPDGPLLTALELSYDQGVTKARAARTGEKVRKPSATPAPIMNQRVVTPYSKPGRADSQADALFISLTETGRVDLARMAELLDTTEDAVIKELFENRDDPLIFKDPESGRWETRDAYLSGQVVRKLAAAIDAGLDKHIKALRAVQPEPIDSSDIAVRLGSVWVPDTMYADFIEHITGSPARVRFAKAMNSFDVIGNSESSASTAQWGTQRMPAPWIISAKLNSKSVVVYDHFKDEYGNKKRVINEEETQLAEQKALELESEFADWIMATPERRDALTKIYNEQFNNRVIRQYDGSFLSLPGKVPDAVIKLRTHQRNAVWRGISERFMLFDHAVGAGKTFTAIARAMERRRMGLSKKPMMVVPNHMVEQFAADVYRLYPGANVLAMGKKDLEAKRRRRAFARIATGDWDIVVIPHSSFEFINIAPEREARYIEERINEVSAAIAEASAANDGQGKPPSVKSGEATLKMLDARLAKLKDKTRDRLLTFEELGVDDLTVDEAHEFKNLEYTTKLERVLGLGSQQGSKKAFGLYNKVRTLRESPTGSVVFMTGTPISNSVVEMYTMMRYLANDTLADMGIEHFDAWQRQFAEVESKFEVNDANQLEQKNRLSRWSNMPELMKIYYSFSDAVPLDDIKETFKRETGKEFPVPRVKGGKPDNVLVQPTRAQQGILDAVVQGFMGLQSIGDRKERNAERLRLMDRARKVSLDARAADPSLVGKTDEAGGKLDVASRRIHEIYQSWSADKGTQLVFLDRSTPKTKKDAKVLAEFDKLQAAANEALRRGDEDAFERAQEQLDKYDRSDIEAMRAAQSGGWNAYDQIKQNLVAMGIPENEVRFIHEANTDDQKQQLFDAVRAGDVRVLIGSTPRMGAGTNVQDRLVALHHIDVNWKPSDIEQREGRIIRQGNLLLERYGDKFEIEVIRYATERTYDAKMWGLNETKGRFINGLRKYEGAREIEVEDTDSENMAEMAALASGDPRMLERVQLDAELKKLEMVKRAHSRQQRSIEDRIQRAERLIAEAPTLIENIRALSDTFGADAKAASADKDARSITIEGKTFKEAADAESFARDAIEGMKGGDPKARFVIKIDGKPYSSLDAVSDAITDTLGDKDPVPFVTPSGERPNRRIKFGEFVATELAKAVANNPSGDFDVGTVHGLPMSAYYEQYGKKTIVTLYVKGDTISRAAEIGSHKEGMPSPLLLSNYATKLAREIRDIKAPDDIEAEAKKAESDLATLRNQAGKPFAKQEEYDTKRARLSELVKILAAEGKNITEDGSPAEANMVEEPTASYTAKEPGARARKKDDYTQDLFGNPVPSAPEARPSARVEPAATENRNLLAAARIPGAKFATVAGPRQIGTLKSGFEKIENAAQAAHALAGMRKMAQEHFAVLVLDKDRKPISVLKLHAGATSQTSVYPEVVTKAVYETPGAAHIWYAHNHPSGNALPSAADEMLTRTLSQAFGEGTGITVDGHVVIAGNTATEIDAEGMTIRSGFDIPARVRRFATPITERSFTKIGKLADPITSPSKGRATILSVSEGKTGIVFLNARNAPVAFVPLTAERMKKLRDGGDESTARMVFGAAARSNATAAILHFEKDVPRSDVREATQNMGEALDSTRDIRLLDTFHRGDSFAEKLEPMKTGTGGVFKSRKKGASRSQGVTEATLKQSFSERLPGLSGALDAMLDRGKKGQKGGLVLIDSADPAEIARVFADKTGASLADAEAGIRESLRIVHDGVRRVGDFIVPETPEFAGNTSGDLAYLNDKPIRLTVGIHRGSHRGFGIVKLAGEADISKRREPPSYTDDRGENFARHVVAVANSASAVYEETGKTIIWAPRMREALVLEDMGDHWSIVSLRPAPKSVWGRPVQTGRGGFQSLSQRSASAPLLSPGAESAPLPGRQSLGVQTEHFDLTDPMPGRQAQQAGQDVKVTVKKRRKIDVQRSSNGTIQGFYDTQSGLQFLVAPNVSSETAPGVILHEAVHGKQEAGLDAKAMGLINGRAREQNRALRSFLDRVAARMEQASESDNATEAMPYIVEQAVTEGRQAGHSAIDGKFMSWVDASIGKTIGDMIRGLVARLRAWAHQRGVPIKTFSVDDFVALAKTAMQSAARGDVKTDGDRAVSGSGGAFDGTNPDIRRSFAGQSAETADTFGLDAARQRIEAGEDAEVVRQETGWHRGLDGKWRFEIADDWADIWGRGSTFGSIYANAWSSAQARGDSAVTVGDVFDHGPLFAAYPSLADIPLRAIPSSEDVSARVKRRGDTVSIEIRENLSRESTTRALLHELQHVIQLQEGFAMGGTANATTAEIQSRAARSAIVDAYGAFAEELQKLGVDTDSMPDLDALMADPDGLIDYYLDEIPRNAENTNAVEWAADDLTRAISKGSVSPYEQYRRLAGEVEARNTETRRKMTAAQRAEAAPSMTADVADADVIVVFNGEEMASAPPPANAAAPVRQPGSRVKFSIAPGDQSGFDMSRYLPGSRTKVEPIGYAGPKVEHWFSNMLKLRGFFESAADTLKRTPGLEPLGHAVVRYYDNMRANRAAVAQPERGVVKALDKLKRPERKKALADFEAHRRAFEQGRKDEAAQILKEANPVVQQMVDAWQQIADVSGDMARAAGVMVMDANTGQYRPMGKVRDFWPRMFNEATENALANRAKHPEMWNRLLDALVADGRVSTHEEAAEYITKYTAEMRETTSQNDYFAGIEKGRSEPLPEIFYDYSWQGGLLYKEAWADRLAQIQAFGQAYGVGPNAQKDLFQKTLDGVTDGYTSEYITRVAARVYNEKFSDPHVQTMQTLNTIATGIQLGNPATALLNLVGGSALTFQAYGVTRSLKELARTVRHWGKHHDYAFEIGALTDDYLAIMHDSERSGVPKWLQQATTTMLKVGGYTPAEHFIRTHNLVVGRSFLRDALKTFNEKPGSRAAARYAAWIKRNGFEVDDLVREGGDGPETKRFLRYSVNLTQGSYKIDQTPVYVDTQVGRFLFKYQKFGTQLSRMFWMNHLRPFLLSLRGGEKIDYEINGVKYSRRLMHFMPMLRFFAVASVAGLGVMDWREELFGYQNKAPTWAEIDKALQDDKTAKALALLADRAWQQAMAVGALGFFGNYWQMGHDIADRQRVKSPFDPPALAPLKSMGELVMRYADQGQLTARDIDDIAQQTVSYYRTGKRAASQALGDSPIFGWSELQVQATKADIAFVKKVSRRYAKEEGLQAKRRQADRYAPTVNTPFNNRVIDAIMVGDVARARLLMREHFGNRENWASAQDRDSALRSLQAAVRARDPSRVGVAPSEAERIAFLRWAKRNTTADEYARILRITTEYRQNATRAGLL